MGRKTDGRKLDHKTLEEIRIRAVKQVQKGESPETVIKTLGFSRQCIYMWLAAYRSGGWHALRSRKGTGRPTRLNSKQIKYIYKTITNKNPIQLKFAFALWTREMIQELIQNKFQIKLAKNSVGRLLRQLGLSVQRPLNKAYEQNEDLVKSWLKEDFPKIKKIAKREKAEIFFGDESGVRSDFHSGSTWAVKGKTPTVTRTGKRYSLNMISAISSRGLLRFMLADGRVDSKVFITFLKRLIHGQKRKIFLILDNHPVHKSGSVKKFVAKNSSNLRIFYLPPYSPELNPDECVWNDVKNGTVGRHSVKSKLDLKAIIISRLKHLQKTPQKIMNFFKTPTTKYILQSV